MHNALTVLAAIALLALPSAPAQSQARQANADLSYTWLEVDYINVDVDDFDDDEDLLDDWDDGGGYAIRGSFAFTPNVFSFARYSETDSDVTLIDNGQVLASSSQDLKRFDIGLGANFPVVAPWIGDSDVVARVAYSDLDLDDFNFGATDDEAINDLDDDSSDGWFADVGLRSQLVDWAEGGIGVRYTDIGDSDNFSLIANVLLEITQNWGVNLELDAGDDIAEYMVGVRYSFERF